MSRTLDSTITNAFCGWTNRNSRSYRADYFSSYSVSDNVMYMDIPIQSDSFELPLFALETFFSLVDNNRDDQVEAIAVCLNTIGRHVGYRTLDRYMKDVLWHKYEDSRLLVCEVKKGNEPVYYYGTCGAVFDKDFNPIMMCFWQVERALPTDGQQLPTYRFIRPVMRIDPSVFLCKDDPIQRFIAGKLLNTCIEITVIIRRERWDIERTLYTGDLPIKVEIDRSPFRVYTPDHPSISTSNQQLLQLAASHLDEIT